MTRKLPVDYSVKDSKYDKVVEMKEDAKTMREQIADRIENYRKVCGREILMPILSLQQIIIRVNMGNHFKSREFT